jgi:hypothetical protein
MKKFSLPVMTLFFCGVLSAQTNYSVRVLAVISSGTTYKAYLSDPLPSEFTVGSSVTIGEYPYGNDFWGSFTISATCKSCSPATFTFTASSGPGGIPCSLTNSATVISSEYESGNGELWINLTDNTKTIPEGLVWVQGTKESSINGAALLYEDNEQGTITQVTAFPQGQAFKTFTNSSDTGTVSWPVNCSPAQGGEGYPYEYLQIATVTVSGQTLSTQTNTFSYIENAAGSETYTFYSATPGLPSGFTAGNIIAGFDGSIAATMVPQAGPDYQKITKACATCSPSYIQLTLPYAPNCALGPTLNITYTMAEDGYFYVEDENPFSAGETVLIQGTEEPLINGGFYPIYADAPLNYFDFANTSYDYSLKADTGTAQLYPCAPGGSDWVYEQ